MICVDASVAAKWILPEEHSDKARALYRVCGQQGERIIGPPLLPVEVTNMLRQRMRKDPGDRDWLSFADAVPLLTQFLSFPVELAGPEGLHQGALALADTYQLPAVYDAHYVALAELLGCPLWTDDQRLLRVLSGKLPFVRWIGDYQPTPWT